MGCMNVRRTVSRLRGVGVFCGEARHQRSPRTEASGYSHGNSHQQVGSPNPCRAGLRLAATRHSSTSGRGAMQHGVRFRSVCPAFPPRTRQQLHQCVSSSGDRRRASVASKHLPLGTPSSDCVDSGPGCARLTPTQVATSGSRCSSPPTALRGSDDRRPIDPLRLVNFRACRLTPAAAQVHHHLAATPTRSARPRAGRGRRRPSWRPRGAPVATDRRRGAKKIQGRQPSRQTSREAAAECDVARLRAGRLSPGSTTAALSSRRRGEPSWPLVKNETNCAAARSRGDACPRGETAGVRGAVS